MTVQLFQRGIVNGLSRTVLVAVVVVAAVVPRAAEASKARLKALSQSTNGSLFIKDERNIFLNPATVNEFDNSATFDWGTKTTIANTATVPSTPAAGQAPNDPNPEGELIYRTDNLNFGLGLGRTGQTANSMIAARALGLYTATPFLPQTALDFVVGGGAGELKWGGGAHYARTTQDTGTPTNYPKNTARELTIAGGLLANKWRGYANLNVIGESTTETATSKTKFDGKLGGEVGGKYDIDSASAVGGAVSRNAFGFDNGAGTTGDLTVQSIGANYFRYLPTKTGSTFFGMAGLAYTDVKVGYSTPTSTSKTYTALTTPVGLGFEHKTLSWLDLRASVTQNVLLDQSKTTDGSSNEVQLYNPESTKVAAGFSARPGDVVTFDATFSGATSGGTLNGTSLAGDVAMIYKF